MESRFEYYISTVHLEIVMARTTTADIRIEYPAQGATYCREQYGVYEYGVHARSSVLSGRVKRIFLDSFDTLAEAKAAYPTAFVTEGCGFVEDRMLDLPDENGRTFNPGDSYPVG